MKLVIFGSTGSVGRLLVEQALAAGHEVTGFARDPSVRGVDDPRLARVRGDVLDATAVADAVAGHDAVLVTLGAGRRGTVRASGTAHVVDAMRRHSVRRLVCQSTLGVGDSRGNLSFLWKHVMFGALLRDAFADHVAQEASVVRSGLDWVIVRPAAFVDAPVPGAACRHGFPPSERGLALKVARADVAAFMLRQLEDDTYLHRTPALSC